MARLRLSRAARRDLVEIGVYTRERWGDAQMAAYLGQLDSRLRSLARAPRQGVPCDEIRAGYWRCLEGRHVIFYRLRPRAVEVMRILHLRMLPRRHL